MSATEILLRAVLAALAAYHLGIGALSVLSERGLRRVARAFYGADLEPSDQLRQAAKMLGLYALALGALLLVAAWRPHEHREIVLVVAGLQLARAAIRIRDQGLLSRSFGIPTPRNALNVSLLVGEAAVLAICFPVA